METHAEALPNDLETVHGIHLGEKSPSQREKHHSNFLHIRERQACFGNKTIITGIFLKLRI